MTKPRRSKGDGSISRRKSGGWRGYVTLPSGIRKYFYGKTRSAVAEQMRLFRIRLERGGPAHEDKRTVAQYLEWWIADQRAHIAPSTWRSYEAKIRLHISPMLGEIRLTRLSPLDVRGLITAKVQHPYSSKQVNHIHDVLHAALEDACRMEIVTRNVASLVETPRIVATERRALTVEQAEKLLQVLNGDRMLPLFRTLLTLGLRPGEGLGLRWQAIDFEAMTIRIEKTLQRIEGQWVLRDPKTRASKQTLPLPRFLADVLLAHRDRQQAEREIVGEHWEDWDLVFPRPHGAPTWYSEAGRYLQKMCEKAGVPVVTLHELRHSTPSILLALGVDQRVIMQILRHSTIVLTANLYTHVADPLVREALDKIDGAFGE